MKVLTEASDDEQEELMRLIKNQNEQRRDRELVDYRNMAKLRSQSLKPK